MGVPSFFAWWVKIYANTILSNKPPRNTKGHKRVLYLDFNGMIHPAVRDDPTLPRSEMNAAVCRKLNEIVTAVNPDEIYIAIDGVAPAAKMDQQRDRRFKAKKESKIKRDIAITHNEPTRDDDVDFNMISPGTEFMWDLQEYLEKHIEDAKLNTVEWKNKTIILNGSGIPGEGEHKIMHAIRARNESGVKEDSYVCGLDADLMFLALGNAHKSVLVRDNVFFRGRDRLDLDPEEYPYVYLDIESLYHILVDTLKPTTTMEILRKQKFVNTIGEFDGTYYTGHYSGSKHDDRRLIIDYMYFCFFLGNDFVPRLPCLKIRDGSLQDIIIIYKRVSWILGEYLINEDYTINRKFLFEFLDEIAYIENELLLQQHDARMKSISRFTWRLKGMPPYKRAITDFDFIENKYVDTIQHGTPGWRIRYYNYHLKWIYRNEKEFKKNILPVCQAYIDGTVWILHYYLGLHSNWSYIYPYSVAPSVSDLCDSFSDINLDIKHLDDTPVSPFVQLLSILPPASAHLLPLPLQDLMTDKDSPIHYMYPLKIVLALMSNRYWHECKAWLPHVDQNILHDIVDMKSKYFTNNEKLRNSLHILKHF